MHHLQDHDIIKLILQGQQKAFAVLVERYQHFVFTIAMRYVSNREQAEELSQDIFMKAYRSLNNFKGNSKFSTWLYTIVHTTCLSSLRKKKDVLVFVEESQMVTTVGNETMADTLELKSTKAMLNEAIAQLHDADAEIIILFYLAEQSLEEIGVIVGQTPNNIKVRLFRARQKLKQVIVQQYGKELYHP